MTPFDASNPLFCYVPEDVTSHGRLVPTLVEMIEKSGFDARTVRGSVGCVLIANGMTAEDANSISDLVFEVPSLGPTQHRGIAGYHPMLAKMLWTVTKRCTVKWIDENVPEHWLRPLFAGLASEDGTS